MKLHLADAELHVFPNSSHMPFYEEPHALLSGAAEFSEKASGPMMADNSNSGLLTGGMAATGLLANGFRVWDDRKPDQTPMKSGSMATRWSPIAMARARR